MLFRMAGADPQQPSRRREIFVDAPDEASAREEVAALGVDTSAWTVTLEKPPKVQLLKGQEVSLGCGTLIVIALIVVMCGGLGTRDIESELRSTTSEVRELKKAVEAQTKQLSALQDKIDKAKSKDEK